MQLDGEAWGIRDATALVAEIDRDLGDRQAHYPEQVRKGRLDQREADYRLELIRDIREDLLFAFAPPRAGEIRATFERGNWRVTWRDKVRWIERELANRQEHYPERVNKGRMTAEEAEQRIAAIANLRRLYWNKLFQWQPPDGPALEYLKTASAPINCEGAEIYRELVRRHAAELELEEAGNKQGELVA